MSLTALDRTKLRTLAIVVAISAVGGALYGTVAVDAEGVSIARHPVLIGAYVGGVIGLSIGGFEIFSTATRTLYWLRRAPFAVSVLLRSSFYLLVFVLAIESAFFIFGIVAAGWEWGDALFLTTVALSFCASFLFNMMLRVNQLLGRGVLAGFLTGRYHRPREEERIFLFLDLVGSTELAERIGHLAFHRLLGDFVADVTEPILAARGEIHSYVGDGIIVSWKSPRGFRHGRCVRCLLDMCRTLETRAAAYEEAYGCVPAFRAALHVGPVIAGEMGVVKQAIVFLGDTVNTTARIEAACRELDATALVSEAVLDRLENRGDFGFEDVGPVTLRGKAAPLRLFRLKL